MSNVQTEKGSYPINTLFFTFQVIIAILSALIVGSVFALLIISLIPIFISGVSTLLQNNANRVESALKRKQIYVAFDHLEKYRLQIIGSFLFVLSVLPAVFGLFHDYSYAGLVGYSDISLDSTLRHCFFPLYSGAVTASSLYALYGKHDRVHFIKKHMFIEENAVELCLLVSMIIMFIMQCVLQNENPEKYTLENYYQFFNCISLFFNLFFALYALLQLYAILSSAKKSPLIFSTKDIILLIIAQAFPFYMIWRGTGLWQAFFSITCPLICGVTFTLVYIGRLALSKKQCVIYAFSCFMSYCMLWATLFLLDEKSMASSNDMWHCLIPGLLYIVLLIMPFVFKNGQENFAVHSETKTTTSPLTRHSMLYAAWCIIPVVVAIGCNLLFHGLNIRVGMDNSSFYSFGFAHPIYRIVDDSASIHSSSSFTSFDPEVNGDETFLLDYNRYVSIVEVRNFEGSKWGKIQYENRWIEMCHLREIEYDAWTRDKAAPRLMDSYIVTKPGGSLVRALPNDQGEEVERLPIGTSIKIDFIFFNSKGNLWGRLEGIENRFIYMGNCTAETD